LNRRHPQAVVPVAALLFSLAAAVAPAAGSEPAPAPLPEGVLAVVDGTPITVEEFRLEMERRGGSQPGTYASAEQRRALLLELVRSRSLAAAARAEGVDRQPAFVATVERLLGAQYLQEHLEPELEAITVDDEEVAAYYEAHRGEFLVPARVRAAWLLVEVARKAGAEERERLRRRAAEARAAAEALGPEVRNLGEVALKYSDDPSTRYTGGELGWLYEEQAQSYRWGPELVRRAFEMSRPGELSPVLEHDAGYYLLKLVERESAAPAPLAKMRGGIRSRLLKEKTEAVRTRFFQRLFGQLSIVADPARVDAIAPLAPTEKPPLAPPPLPGG